jgi:hypothetical protein
MADVKNIVTLGVGAAPGNLIWFITSGLEGAAAVAVPSIIMVVPYQSYTMVVPYESRTTTVPFESRTMIVPANGAE